MTSSEYHSVKNLVILVLWSTTYASIIYDFYCKSRNLNGGWSNDNIFYCALEKKNDDSIGSFSSFYKKRNDIADDIGAFSAFVKKADQIDDLQTFSNFYKKNDEVRTF